MKDKNEKNIPHISGIDALYYFAQSGGNYDNYYMDIIDQIEDKKAEFTALNYPYTDKDIIININNIDLQHSGTGRDGFLWFNHEFFRVGFKDSEKAKNIHNIRVQLNAIGIYTLGIKSLVEYINTKLLKGALLKDNYFPVTRIDVNMFVQHSFNYLKKEMIVSKKKNHSANIGERSTGYELETYYVGKSPFMLRIYNKMKELESASSIKKEIMYNYFGVNGLDIEKPIFNVEFELHREFLKRYGIDTIEDALSRSQSLFEMGCKLIKLVDISKLTNKQFMQITTPMEKVERISYRYSLEDARKPIKRLITRLLLHGNSPTLFYFYELLQNTKEDFELRDKINELHKEEKPTLKDDFKTYSDEGLLNFEMKLSKEMSGVEMNEPQFDELLYTYNELHDELVNRGLVKIPF